MNSFIVLHSGNFSRQEDYLEQMKMLDAYFVPHSGYLAALRAHGVNALEMPFFYDPERYFPLSKVFTPSFLGEIPVLFIGSVSESAANNRRQIIEALSKKVQVHVITFKDPKIENVIWHRPTNKPMLLNWWQARARLILNIEDVGETYSPESLNPKHCTIPTLQYADRKVFHGNHVFQAMGSGRICLSEHSEPLLRFCEPGRDILTWKSAAEAGDKALEILAKPDELSRMQEAAFTKVRSLHAAETRIREILGQIDQIPSR